MTFLKINLYLFIYILGVVNARSDGAPSAPSVCVNLEPGHGSEPMPNDGVGPFKSVPTTCSVDKGLSKYIDETYQSVMFLYSIQINVNLIFISESIKAGENVTLTVQAKPKRQFRGFVIQAVDQNGAPIGEFTFDRSQRTKCLQCGDSSCATITHKNAGGKVGVVATWTSPNDFNGKVLFRYTVVTSYFEYWVNIYGPSVIVEI